MTELQKMLAGERYDPMDEMLVAARRRARVRTHAFNATAPHQTDERLLLLRELFPNKGKGVWIEPPFFCDYGDHITFGDNVFLNFNCVFLDAATVTIGSRVMFGSAVQVCTATHPLNAKERAGGKALAKAIRIGDDVWIGSGAIIGPGVTIGARAVVGAGAVVSCDVAADTFVAGNPAQIVEEIPR